MKSFFSRWFSKTEEVPPLPPGVYQCQAAPDAPVPYRLHLRIESDGTGVLIINAATLLHLNPTAAAYALQIVQGAGANEAASAIADRYRVSRWRARRDYEELRARILSLATNPDLDPTLYLGIDRAEPLSKAPSAPYRIDLALTYALDPDGKLDPLARKRVDRELTTEEWTTILSKAWDAGIPHVTFTGGEPTRRADLVDLVTFAEELGQVTGLLTQGGRLADQAYMERLSNAGLDHLLIVLRPEVADNLQGIQNAVASEVFTAVHLTLTGKLASQAAEWLQKLRDIGVGAVSLSVVEASEEAKQLLERTRQRAAELGLSLVWDLPVPYCDLNPIHLELESPPERAGSASLYVEPDGDVLPAQGVDRILGNLLRDEWNTIWAEAQGQQG